MSDKAREILKELTLEEKAKLCSGKNFWQLESVLDLPTIMVTDGPHGLRKQKGDSDHIGLSESVDATCFPTAVGLASTWDNKLVEEVGEYLADECLTEDVSVLLGPGANIKRNPLCGRNFEYLSEDPILTGKMASSLIDGIQSKGIGTSMKHYVANNQETMRMAVDTFVDERTMREMYLKGFEIAVKESQPWTVMCSYNKVNGEYLSEHKYYLQDILKDEWGHEGIVVTDWGACNDRVKGLIAGQELEMPSSNGHNNKRIVEAVRSGVLDEKLLDTRVERVIDLILKSRETLKQDNKPFDKEKHHSFARKVAADTMVLLKNEDNILPLNSNQKVALIGGFAKTPRYQGSGSSLIKPTKLGLAYDAFKEVLGENFSYAEGYSTKTRKIDETKITEAVEVAKKADVVVLMIGLTDDFESEGFDRTHLNIPGNQLKLIEELSKVNKNIVVSMSNGSPIVTPWQNRVKAIIEQYLAGQASGEALCDVVFGKVNPSGKLAETFPNNLEEIPSSSNFPGLPRQVEYREGLYVGYRYYDTVKLEPLYPFGYGLSYTSFEYSDLTVKDGEVLEVIYTIKNTGDVLGKEVSQVYISKSKSNLYRPTKELKGYEKVELQPGESKEVTVKIPKSYLEVYSNGFKLEEGTYKILVGSSSRDIKLTEELSLKGETIVKSEPAIYHNIDVGFNPSREEFEELLAFKIPEYPKVRPFTMNSVLGETTETFIGKQIMKMIGKELGKMLDASEDPEAMRPMLEAVSKEMPLRAMAMLGGDNMSPNRVQGIVDLMNKKFFRGMYKAIKG